MLNREMRPSIPFPGCGRADEAQLGSRVGKRGKRASAAVDRVSEISVESLARTQTRRRR
jgi:hypothetical protein